MDEQTETSKSQTPENEGQTKTPKGRTVKRSDNPKGGRPARVDEEPSKWTLRWVDLETRAIIYKAADKSGQTLGDYFNGPIREFCSGQIKKSKQPPAAPDDILGMMDAKLTTMGTTLKEDILTAVAGLIAAKEPEKKPFIAKLRDLFR